MHHRQFFLIVIIILHSLSLSRLKRLCNVSYIYAVNPFLFTFLRLCNVYVASLFMLDKIGHYTGKDPDMIFDCSSITCIKVFEKTLSLWILI